MANIIATGLKTISGIFSSSNNAQQRTFGSITGLMTIREESRDNLTMTEHPVEKGANVTDHAFMQPKTLSIEFAYGDASFNNPVKDLIDKGANLIQSGTNPFSSSGSGINDMYDQILKLQKDRILLDVVTGKRKYSNMLIESVSNTTDAHSENILLISISLKEIIIVETKVTEVSKNNQADSKTTGGTTNTGQKQLGR